MAKVIDRIENLTDPGQPLEHFDRYRTFYTDNTYRDGRHVVNAGVALVATLSSIRVITLQAFYRRMTQAERNIMRRSNSDDINDLREDLQRMPYVNLDDPNLLTMMQATPFTDPRIDELLADGTEAEAYSRGSV